MLEKQKIIHMYIAGGKSLREISRELGVLVPPSGHAGLHGVAQELLQRHRWGDQLFSIFAPDKSGTLFSDQTGKVFNDYMVVFIKKMFFCQVKLNTISS